MGYKTRHFEGLKPGCLRIEAYSIDLTDYGFDWAKIVFGLAEIELGLIHTGFDLKRENFKLNVELVADWLDSFVIADCFGWDFLAIAVVQLVEVDCWAIEAA